MLRLLGPTDLEGYVFQSPGGPKCELFTGVVSKMQADRDAIWVCIRGKSMESGEKVFRTATILFENRGSDRKMLKTRLIAAGVSNGVYLSVLSMQRNNRRIALDFKFSGLWRLKGYKGELNVLFGKYYDPKLQDDLVSIRFLDYNSARNRYYRRTVDITDAEILQTAKDVFFDKKHNACVCICGPEQKSSSAYRCRWFEMIEDTIGKPIL